MTDSQITVLETNATTKRPSDPDSIDRIELGDWYWFKCDEDKDETLWCVTKIGSNFAELSYPFADGTTERRVHFDQWAERCRHEANPQTWFDLWASEEKKSIRRINQEIHDICARLGVSPDNKRIGDGTNTSNLAVVSSATNADDYKTALIKAQKDDLPALFEQVKVHSGELKRWLRASSLSLTAQCGDMKETIGVVNDRIFMVSVYAGLAEKAALVRDGKPAEMGEKLRLMQGKLFMDEECLLNYSIGGMEFKDISEFDGWIANPENADRILPFQRCIVAFQVRRNEKERSGDGTLQTAWINFELAQDDKRTFLYIRNGESLYRLDTELEFGDELFADKNEFVFEQMMVSRGSGHQTMTMREYDDRVVRHQEKMRKHRAEKKLYEIMNKKFKEWKESNPDADESESGIDGKFRSFCGPYLSEDFRPKDWSVLNDSNVYLDDINDRIRKQANEYNKISTMIQGLLDRSEILHPHPPVKLWTPKGFEQFIELIYDHDRTLFDGAEPPSWEAYKSKCGESIGIGSVVFGQHDIWYASLPRETRRNDRGYSSGTYVPYIYTEGNPGPGEIAVVTEVSKRTKKVTFRWKQTRWIHRASRWENSGNRTYDRSISVPCDQLFNISAYKPGDYKNFFNDPRTRQQYIKWANLLLTAEEYHAGNLDPVMFKKRSS